MKKRAFQDFYSEDFSYCFGCGSKNENGHQLKTYWEGDKTVSNFTPKPEHIALPGFVYGGLIASIIDCHSTGSGAAALYKASQNKTGTYPRCVTASLKIEYLKPTPLSCELKLIGNISEMSERKVRVLTSLFANNSICAKGDVIVVKVPKNWQPK
jgi:acyl-coenzyme A thioesterase PaaI-like protein